MITGKVKFSEVYLYLTVVVSWFSIYDHEVKLAQVDILSLPATLLFYEMIEESRYLELIRYYMHIFTYSCLVLFILCTKPRSKRLSI